MSSADFLADPLINQALNYTYTQGSESILQYQDWRISSSMLLLNLKILSPQDVLRVVRFIIGHQIKSSIAPEMVETVPVCYGQFGDVSKIIFINRSALERYDVRNAIRYQSEGILACIQDLKCGTQSTSTPKTQNRMAQFSVYVYKYNQY